MSLYVSTRFKEVSKKDTTIQLIVFASSFRCSEGRCERFGKSLAMGLPFSSGGELANRAVKCMISPKIEPRGWNREWNRSGLSPVLPLIFLMGSPLGTHKLHRNQETSLSRTFFWALAPWLRPPYLHGPRGGPHTSYGWFVIFGRMDYW